jgi:hypothetical protein
MSVPSILFDTGALRANYINELYVYKHIQKLQPYLIPTSAYVYLADGNTRVTIDYKLRLTISLPSRTGPPITTSLDFYMLPIGANDMIIGLPAIIKHFIPLVSDLLWSAHDSFSHSLSNLDSSAHTTSIPSGLQLPWSTTNLSVAPEDLETELPVQFSDYLHFMEVGYDTALQQFLDAIPKQVHPDFAAQTDIVNLLRTKGVRVFVPQNWEGIQGIDPLELVFKPTLPAEYKPKLRHTNPKLMEAAKIEFDRLSEYLYVPSDSPIASTLVIAPKATPPFIRFCGNYVEVNKHIDIPPYPIPNVQYSLEKIRRFKVFVDLDWVNSFHQIRLALYTSNVLSIITQWGLVRPLFMPEGVGPASGILQRIVADCFKDFDEWSIAIFDNLLVLADDYDDAYRKCNIIFDRCIERNIYLKFSKTFLGFPSAKFFGYLVQYGKYELTDDRKLSLSQIPFPTTTKKLQSFLGSALFFKAFIPHYSSLTSPLNDMLRKDFNWNPKTWSVDYQSYYQKLLNAIQNSAALYYPDYTLEWILRTDASIFGVGAVLLQLTPTNELQPIGFASQKFSPAATRWSTIEQESYGIYFAVKHFSYFLACKPFILETDHRNLLWMEASAVPKIIRWKIYLQDFSFLIRHISGKNNNVADWLSRVHEPLPTNVTPPDTTLALIPAHTPDKSYPDMTDAELRQLFGDTTTADIAQTPSSPQPNTMPPETPAPQRTIETLFNSVHNARVGHNGLRRTWKLLNNWYPGHKIPVARIRDLIDACPICLKHTNRINDQLTSLTRPLHPEHVYAQIGVDTLTVTPPDTAGNTYLLVIVNHFTKLVDIYPAPDKSALSTATAIFNHICTYGLVEKIYTDPGTEFQNSILASLEKWLGIKHHFSIVDRHESNGVERTNGRILHLLRTIVAEERIKHKWSDPTILGIIKFLLNSRYNDEVEQIPFDLHFGAHASTYHQLPLEILSSSAKDQSSAYLQQLNEYFTTILEVMDKFHIQRVSQRTGDLDITKHNTYQPGDFILLARDESKPRPSKLSPKYLGPYEVISHNKNDIKAKHLVMDSIHTFHVNMVKLFTGTQQQAFTAALEDFNQYEIERIISYAGDPLIRSKVDFEVVFKDGSVIWLPYSHDLSNTLPFEEFCRSRLELRLLLISAALAQTTLSQWRKSPITSVKPGDHCWVLLRSYGPAWYLTLPLPDVLHIDYYIEHQYSSWINTKHTKIKLICPLFNETYPVDNSFIELYGLLLQPPSPSPTTYILSKQDLTTYPCLLEKSAS